MSKLLRAGVRRYTHNIIFWLGLALSFAIGLVRGYMTASDENYEGFYFIFPLLIISAVISLMISPEFSDGIFRNKVLAGHSKGKIYISEMILALCTAVIMFLLTSVGFAIFNLRLFQTEPVPVMPYPSMPWIFVGFLFVTIAFTAIFLLVSLTVSHKAIAPIICVVMALLIYFVAFGIADVFEQPEFLYKLESVKGEDGYTYLERTDPYPNPKYVGGVAREILTVVYRILPFSHIIECEKVFSPMLPELSINLSLTAERLHILQFAPVWLGGFTIIILALGYVIFRKKDLK